MKHSHTKHGADERTKKAVAVAATAETTIKATRIKRKEKKRNN